MTASRAAILDAIRRNRPPTAELPGLQDEWTTYDDPRRQFIEVLESVGGRALIVPSRKDLAAQLQQLPQLTTAQHAASLVTDVPARNVDLTAIDSPHALESVDVAILPGEFAVAENAAVWVTDQHVPLRVIYFLCQHLVLVVPANHIVPHMHAAYQRLAFSRPQFGVFISGPSKTADIEQSLVIGAHGPRSLTVCFVDD